jgi:hypothetical protein
MGILDVFLYVTGAGKAVRDFRLSHGLDNRGIMGWFPGGDRIFSNSPKFLDWRWDPPTSRLVGTRDFFSWVKWPRVWSWPPGPSGAKFKNEWSCIPAPPYTFMPWAVTSLPFPMCLIIAAVFYRTLPGDDARHKNVLLLSRLHYEKSSRLMLQLERPLEFLRVQMERVALSEFQAQSTWATSLVTCVTRIVMYFASWTWKVRRWCIVTATERSLTL